MASEKQTIANRRNAQKSTGPNTPEGKAAVSGNAVKHGLRTRFFLRALPEYKDDFREAFEILRAEFPPATSSEHLLIERMALTICKSAHVEATEALQLWIGDYSKLGHIWPHQARLDRTYDKALAHLRAFQKERAKSTAATGGTAAPVAAPQPPEPETPSPDVGAAPAPPPPVPSSAGDPPHPKLALFVPQEPAAPLPPSRTFDHRPSPL